MEDYEEEMHGVEDSFHSQFAAELEVLAELEGGCASRRGLVTRSCTGSWAVPGSLRGLHGRGEASEGQRQQRPGGGEARERERPSSAAVCGGRLS